MVSCADTSSSDKTADIVMGEQKIDEGGNGTGNSGNQMDMQSGCNIEDIAERNDGGVDEQDNSGDVIGPARTNNRTEERARSSNSTAHTIPEVKRSRRNESNGTVHNRNGEPPRAPVKGRTVMEYLHSGSCQRY